MRLGICARRTKDILMHKKVGLFLGIVLVLATTTSFAAPSQMLFVVMGGYKSCGSAHPAPNGIGMYAPFKKMISSVRSADPEAQVHYLISCLNSEAPPNGKAQYLTSEDPNRVLSGNANVLMNEVERLAEGKENLAVFIAGHSYGGWLSMYLGEKLRLKAPILGLFTVDPIGPACGPMQVVFGGSACKKAPTDLNNLAIRTNVANWVNFYQNQDSWLHSGEIKEAENMHVQYRGPHTEIDSDARTWNRITTAVVAVVKQPPKP